MKEGCQQGGSMHVCKSDYWGKQKNKY